MSSSFDYIPTGVYNLNTIMKGRGIFLIKKYSFYIVIALIIIGVFGYRWSLTFGINQISTDQLVEYMSLGDPDLFFVDVREQHEFREGYIEGMINIPLSTLDREYKQIPKHKEIVIICRSGNRSLQAANKLKRLGYKNLTNVKGGMLEWEGNIIR